MNTHAMSGRAQRSSSDAGSADGSSTSNGAPERSPTHRSNRCQAARSDGDQEYIRADAIIDCVTSLPRNALAWASSGRWVSAGAATATSRT